MKQNIMLGNRELGELYLSVLSHTWEEQPQPHKDRMKTDKKLYIEVLPADIKALAMFYSNVVDGDRVAGLESKMNMYFDIVMVKGVDSNPLSKWEYKARYPEFDNFHTSDLPKDAVYVVQVN